MSYQYDADGPFSPTKKKRTEDLYHTERNTKKRNASSAEPSRRKTPLKVKPISNTSHHTSTPDPIHPSTSSQKLVADITEPLDPVEAYALEVLRNESFIRLAQCEFALQEFNAQKGVLKPKEFLYLRCREITFCDGAKQVWMCSCCPSLMSFYSGLQGILSSQSSTVITDRCRHVKVVERLMIRADLNADHDYYVMRFTRLSNHDDGAVLAFVPGKEKPLGLVQVRFELSDDQKPYLYCYRCKHKSCHHVRLVEGDLASGTPCEALAELDMFLHSDMFEWSQRRITKVKFRQSITPIVAGRPEVVIQRMSPPACSCGQGEFKRTGTCRTYYSTSYQNTEVFSFVCPCGEILYNGTADELLNFGYYAISHCVMRTYLMNFLTVGMPMYSYYTLWLQQMFMWTGNNMAGHLRYGMFRSAVLEMMTMLEYDDKKGFLCPECGPHPKSFSDRVFIPNKDARKLLREYAEGKDVDRKHLLGCMAVYQNSISGFLQKNEACPEYAKRLLTDLSTSSPVCALLLPEDDLLAGCLKMVQGDRLDAEEQKTLHASCLSLYHCLDYGKLTDVSLAPVVKEMLEIAQHPFRIASHKLGAAKDESWLAFYPNMPAIRSRGQYVKDNKQSTGHGTCTKVSDSGPTLLPGVFNMLCQHGLCYGFEVMTNCESPNTLFTILTTRYVDAPDFVIYDNSCNLMQYALNRNPGFFSHTRFVSDRLHRPNHHWCSSGHDMDSYSALEKYNSQVAEQRHALLLKLKPMLSYMTACNFMQFMKLFHWFHNSVKMGGSAPQFPEHFKELKQMCKRQ